MSPGLPSSGPFVTREQDPCVVQATVWSGFLLLMSEHNPQQEQAACSRPGVYNNTFIITLLGKEDSQAGGFAPFTSHPGGTQHFVVFQQNCRDETRQRYKFFNKNFASFQTLYCSNKIKSRKII